MSRTRPKPVTAHIRRYLTRTVMRQADARRRYRWAIREFEKHMRGRAFDEQLSYSLGLLYDHLAIFSAKKRATSIRFREYLRRAAAIYRGILARNSNNLFAHHGLARVYGEQKNFSRAILHARKAYRIMLRRPKKQRGALGVGYIYFAKKDLRGAERWLKRELKDLGEHSVAANANLMSFYFLTKNFRKALPCALRTEKLLRRELLKPIYQGIRAAKSNKTVRILMERIKKIKARPAGRALKQHSQSSSKSS